MKEYRLYELTSEDWSKNYIMESLASLVVYIKSRYTTVEELEDDEIFINSASSFVGEVFINEYSGEWGVECDPDDVFFGERVYRKGFVKDCPRSLITACVTREDSDYIYDIFKNYGDYLE